ncbi:MULTISPECIES: hypothetical protein [Thiomicrorhabdus]|uniref:Uncharacterized protein n=1 Tax=Thiomicrorhabdus heinhorstiae TaxID=2748010 RepID=A0ABS0BYA4_9GAMM|nr:MULTISPECIES: hypothetical protein [Thiomicrorhabdus]MBF6058782.1 hypothetical protein [Thiomicrorhabdus heinhorstiae]
MPDSIHQMHATYHAVEDRILLKIKTHNQCLYQAWLTRRFITLFLPALHGKHPNKPEMLLDDDAISLPEMEDDFMEMLSAILQAPFEEPEAPEFPLGEEPLLLSRMTFENLDTPEATWILEPEDGNGIELPYHPNLLTPMLQIMNKALQKANWQLNLEPILEMSQGSRLQ